MRNFKKGFTLIEVLIVVAIIAILASVILVGLGPTSRAGRDARRISDLRQLQTGLELYYRFCGYYPGPVASARADCAPGAGGQTDYAGMSQALVAPDTQNGGTVLGVTQVPNDPTNGQTYEYESANGTSYTLRAQLENHNDPAIAQMNGFQDNNTGAGTLVCDPGDGSTGVYCVGL